MAFIPPDVWLHAQIFLLCQGDKQVSQNREWEWERVTALPERLTHKNQDTGPRLQSPLTSLSEGHTGGVLSLQESLFQKLSCARQCVKSEAHSPALKELTFPSRVLAKCFL